MDPSVANAAEHRVRKELVERGLEDRILKTDRELHTARATAEYLRVDVSSIARTVAVTGDDQPVLVVAPGSDQIDRRHVAAVLGSTTVSLARPDELWDRFGFPVDGVSPLGSRPKLRVLIDSRLDTGGPVWAAAGSGRALMHLTFPELIELSSGVVIDAKLVTTRRTQRDDFLRRLGVQFEAAELHGLQIEKTNGAVENLKKEVAAELKDKRGDVDRERRLASYRDVLDQVGAGEAVASPQALVNLILRRGRLPTINTAVDAYNAASARYGIVASAHREEAFGAVLELRRSRGEKFHPLDPKASEEKVPTNEWLCWDGNHVVCRLNCKQSALSSLTGTESRAILYVQGAPAFTEGEVRRLLYEVCSTVLRSCGGRHVGLLDERPEYAQEQDA